MFNIKCSELSNELIINPINTSEIYRELITIRNCANNSKKIIHRSKYSKNITKLRKIYRKDVAIYKKDKSNESLRKLMYSRKTLQKEIRKEKRKMKNENLEKLIIAKENNDHKTYWHLINSKKKKFITSNLNSVNFLNEFKNADISLQHMTSKAVIELTSTISNEILDKEITMNEIKKHLNATKNGKSSGPDELASEMLKESENTLPILLLLFNQLLNNKDEIPFAESWIVPVYKKGDKNVTSSYRPINLSSNVEKLLTKILNERLNQWLKENDVIHLSQTGFQKGSSTMNNIYIIKEILQIYKNSKHSLYISFIDLSKAFDSIPKTILIEKLHSLLPNSNFLHLLKRLITDKRYKILYDGVESEAFNLQKGLPQGDSLSPTLFSIFMNSLAKEIYANIEVTNAATIGSIADDILLMSNDKVGLLKQIEIVNNFCNVNGLKINYDKTKIMIHNVASENDYLDINLNNYTKQIEIVKEYKYLGFWISNNTKKHLLSLTKKGNQSAYLTNKKLKELGEVNGTIVRNTFEMLALSKMMYGGEFCFHNKLSELNKIQFQFYKRFYHLSATTANYRLIGEFGLLPLEYYFYKAAINFWIRILFSQNKCIMKICFDHISLSPHRNSYLYT